jgi:hypothetical protein
MEIGKLKSLSNDVEGALVAFKEGDDVFLFTL